MQMSWLELHLKDWVMADAWPPMDSKELGSEIYETHPIPCMKPAEILFSNSDEVLASGK